MGNTTSYLQVGGLIFLITLGLGQTTVAQVPDFEPVLQIFDQGFIPRVTYGSIAYANLRHDDVMMDLIFTGRNSNNDIHTYVVRGTLSDFGAIDEYIQDVPPPPHWVRHFEIPEESQGVWKGSTLLADLDHNNHVDLIVGGATSITAPLEPWIYFLTTDGVLTGQVAGVYNGSYVAGDVNNDGDLDVMMTGINHQGRYVTRLLQHQESAWRTVQTALPDVAYSTIALSDLDGDGDLDLFISGVTEEGEFLAHLYAYDNGTFQALRTDLPPVIYGSTAWGDYDNDGDADLAYAGGQLDPLVGYRGVMYLIRNDVGTFTRVPTDLPGMLQGDLAWGDVNNDGMLDLLITGMVRADGSRLLRIFFNENGSLSQNAVKRFVGFGLSSAGLGDYDIDGDLDFVVSGTTSDTERSLLSFRNESTIPNSAPAAPEGLATIVEESTVHFSWQAPVDDYTPSQSLTYNLRVGATTGGIDVMSPLANLETGLRWVARAGNTGLGTTYFLRDLPPGTYYWSVQAIDTGFMGSPFAEEGTFVID